MSRISYSMSFVIVMLLSIKFDATFVPEDIDVYAKSGRVEIGLTEVMDGGLDPSWMYKRALD